MNSRLRTCLVALVPIGFLVAAAGCGGGVAAKGQLNEDGKPFIITDAKHQPSLRFVSEADAEKSYAGNLNKDDGTFTVTDVGGSGIPRGKYKVVVEHKIPYPMGKDKYDDRYSLQNSKLFVDVTGAALEINLTTK